MLIPNKDIHSTDLNWPKFEYFSLITGFETTIYFIQSISFPI